MVLCRQYGLRYKVQCLSGILRSVQHAFDPARLSAAIPIMDHSMLFILYVPLEVGMSVEMEGIIEKALDAFSFGQMQDFLTMYMVMGENDISVANLQAYVNGHVVSPAVDVTVSRGFREKMPDCPNCGEKLAIQPIRIPKGKRNINGWKSLWRCTSDDCAYEAYSHMTAEEERKQLGREKWLYQTRIGFLTTRQTTGQTPATPRAAPEAPAPTGS